MTHTDPAPNTRLRALLPLLVAGLLAALAGAILHVNRVEPVEAKSEWIPPSTACGDGFFPG